MTSIGKVTTSFASGTIENTLALANLNLDFSIIKVEAPKEFMSLGANLAPQRRAIAEDGYLHRTARKLGALFEEILPSSPQLIKSYGKRASEISLTETANPKSDHKYGAFAAYVGADATSIWAAATSGSAAIGVHLLACMLARTWTGPEATSIWVEIVEERIRIITSKATSDAYNTSIGGLVAANQGVTRMELAQWDASARAWLQVADDAKRFQQKQLMLILNNLSLPVNRDKSAYENVIGAWQASMKAVEKLASGQPQSVSKGAVLLGIAAWHLYPDLLVFGEKVSDVKFSDPAMSPGGSLTIGLQDRSRGTDDGVYWSLALSHLRYYGDPVIVDTSIGHGTSRLNFEELHLIALGSVLAGWGPLGKDIEAATGFFVALWDCLQRATQTNDHHVDIKLSRQLLSPSSWIFMLYNASKTILGPQGVTRDVALTLVALGRRRGHKFLAESKNHPPALFGLSSLFIFNLLSHPLGTKQSEKIIMMRSIAEQLQLDPHTSIICIPRQGPAGCYEYATALAHPKCSQTSLQLLHQRWVEVTYDDAFQGCSCHNGRRECSRIWGCECVRRGTICTPLCHGRPSVTYCGQKCPKKCVGLDTEHILSCTNLVDGEVYHYIQKGSFPPINTEKGVEAYHWSRALANKIDVTSGGRRISNYLIRHTWTEQRATTMRYPAVEIATLCDCYLEEIRLYQELIRKNGPINPKNEIFEPAEFEDKQAFSMQDALHADHDTEGQISLNEDIIEKGEEPKNASLHENASLHKNASSHKRFGSTIFNILAGDVEDVALFCIPQKMVIRKLMEAISNTRSAPLLSVATITSALQKTILPESLVRYLADLTFLRKLTCPRFQPDLHIHVQNLDKYMRSLIALSLATELYQKQLPGATVAIDIMSQSLYKASWIPESKRLNKDFLRNTTPSLGRRSILSCIAMFESGSYNLRPEELKDVMGVAVRNTIYASKTLLFDPYDLSHTDDVAMIIGNVGRTGMTLMVSPPTPRIRSSELNSWKHITHAEFDGKAGDFFQPTSLHLSFTEFELPMDKRSRGTIDKDLSVVETLVSVHDRGEWLADIDVLPLFEEDTPLLRRALPCGDCCHGNRNLPTTLTSLDNWEEVLDPPEDIGNSTVGIVRAHKNWLARLAAACVSIQRGQRTVILPPENICWHCICRRSWHWPTVEKPSRYHEPGDSDECYGSDSLSDASFKSSRSRAVDEFKDTKSNLQKDPGASGADEATYTEAAHSVDPRFENEDTTKLFQGSENLSCVRTVRGTLIRVNTDTEETLYDTGSDDSQASATTAIGHADPKSETEDFDDSRDEGSSNSSAPLLPEIFIM